MEGVTCPLTHDPSPPMGARGGQHEYKNGAGGGMVAERIAPGANSILVCLTAGGGKHGGGIANDLADGAGVTFG